MATSVLEELVTVLGYEIDDDDLKKYDKTLTVVRSGMKAFTLAAAAAGAGLAVFTQHAAASNDALFRFSKTVGNGFEDIQRFVHATEAMGGTLEDAMSTIANLEALAAKASLGKGGGAIFGFLNVVPTDQNGIKKGVELFKELADALLRVKDVQLRTDLAGELGISRRSLLLLSQGSDEISRLSMELDRIGFVFTESQGEEIRKFMKTMHEMETIIRGVGNQIVLRFAPQITEIVHGFIEWAAANKDLADSGLDTWLDNLAKLVGPAKIMAAILLAIFIAANLSSAAILAVAAAVAILTDDFFKFHKGMKGTLTGKLFDSLDDFGEDHPNLKRLNELHGSFLGAIDDQLFGGIFDDFGTAFLGDSTQGKRAQERRAGNTTNNIQIAIDGALGPIETGKAVRDALKELMLDTHEAVTVGPRT